MTDATATMPSPASSNVLAGDDKLWIVLSHLSILFGVGLLLPLVVYLVRKDSSPDVRHHAAEALNFHLTVVLYTFIGALLVLVLIGIPMLAALALAVLILSIVAAVQGAEGVRYRYPLTIRLIS